MACKPSSAHRRLLSLLSALLSSLLSLHAAPPTVTTLDVRGLQIAHPTTLTLTGTDLLPNPRLLTTARIAKQSLKDGAKPDRITLDIELAPGTSPGLHNWWLVTDHGISAKGVLAADHLPQKPFADKVDALPVALHGVISGSQVREVTFPGKAGQELICEVEAQRLDGRLRPVLKLHGPGNTLLHWSQPQLALRGDTRLELKLPADGEYRLQLHDLQFAAPGNSNYFRLKLGQWTYADLAFPAMVQRGASAEVQLVGRAGESRTVSLPALGNAAAVPAPWADAKSASGPQAVVWLSDLPELVETRTGSSPQALPALPVAVNGRLSKAGESDAYTLTVTPETEVEIEVSADSLGSPIDAELELRDLKGARLALNDDFTNRPDPRLTYKVPKDVTNVVAVVRDVNANGGPRCLYRLQAKLKSTNAPAGFTLLALEDNLTLPAARTAVFKVEARRDGYDGPIELAFDALPAGVKLSGQTIPARATATLLTLASDAPLPPLITALHGRAKDRDVLARAESPQLGKFQPWLENDLALAGAPKPEVDFTIAWGKDAATNSIPLGGKLTLPTTCARPLGHDGPVRLTLLTSQARLFLNNAVDPARVLREEKAVLIEEDKKAQAAFDAIAPATNALAAAQKELAIAKDDPAKAAATKKVQAAETALDTARKAAAEATQKATNSAAFALIVPGELADLPHQLAFKAELLKRDRRTVTAVAYTPVRDFPVLNPLALKLAALAPVKLDAKTGASLDVVGQVERLNGAKGDVTVTLTGLPAGVTARATVAVKDGATEFKFPLKFPAGFKPGDFTGLKLSASGKPFAAATVKSRDTEFAVKVLAPEPPPVKQAEAKK
ncbi:MAG: hypothetical protein B9S33_08660 [Pedosphaera sp. Tous-C6FEB]|nr:MAG: hypothetical protein B9S33_08660 [Pedosphaera sp. Tous-C6FEB]